MGDNGVGNEFCVWVIMYHDCTGDDIKSAVLSHGMHGTIASTTG